MNLTLLSLAISVIINSQSLQGEVVNLLTPLHAEIQVSQDKEIILASRELSLTNRHQSPSTNEVFRKNILLNLAYLDQSVTNKKEIDWEKVQEPSEFSIALQPGQTFAYHDDVLAQYDDSLAITTNAHFDSREGFLSSGFLYGDGVCHLASIINWAAQDAGLDVYVTKLHSIAVIPDIPDEYGVSIYTQAGVKGSGARNNLYITNNQDYPVEFVFRSQSDTVTVQVIKTTEATTPVALHRK